MDFNLVGKEVILCGDEFKKLQRGRVAGLDERGKTPKYVVYRYLNNDPKTIVSELWEPEKCFLYAPDEPGEISKEVWETLSGAFSPKSVAHALNRFGEGPLFKRLTTPFGKVNWTPANVKSAWDSVTRVFLLTDADKGSDAWDSALRIRAMANEDEKTRGKLYEGRPISKVFAVDPARGKGKTVFNTFRDYFDADDPTTVKIKKGEVTQINQVKPKPPVDDMVETPSPPIAKYRKLLKTVLRAYNRAANGKGKDRHATGQNFEDQPMLTIQRMLGSHDGSLYQAMKKIQESKRLEPTEAVMELLDAIVYLAGAVILIEEKR